ncbi:ankyrin repeat-containing domain protein [Trichoderma evansii]
MPSKLLGNAVADLRATHEINGHQINEDIARILDSHPRLKKSYRRPDFRSDKLYRSDVVHPPGEDEDCATVYSDGENRTVIRPERTEDDDNPAIHYGVIASANQSMKNAVIHDQFANAINILCFEMEAAGLMNDFPCLVIRAICDYADSHKNKQWQGYAAMVAAAYARDLLSRITPTQIEAEKTIREIVTDIQTIVSTTAADVEVVKADVTKKANIKVLDWFTAIKGWQNRTPLSWAAEHGHEAIVKLLLENGADINMGRDELIPTPLGWAAQNGHEAIVRLLLENGADIDWGNIGGRTPLIRAIVKGREAVVRLLLEKDADLNLARASDDMTPLMLAARDGHEAIFRLLLEKGADPNIEGGPAKMTPLKEAAAFGHEAIVRLLLEKKSRS